MNASTGLPADPITLRPPMARASGLWDAVHGRLLQRRADRWITAVPVLTSSLLSKLSVPPFGALGLTLSIPLVAAVGAAGLMTGRLVADRWRLVAFSSLLALLCGIQLLRATPFSLASLLLFTVLHFPYVLQLQRPADYSRVLGFFQGIALTIATLGLLQYTLQFVTGPELAYPIENHFPEAFKVSKFNMQGYVEYGSQVYRTNGVFMLEPSYYSQLLAVAMVVEFVTRVRPWALVVLAAGILVSFAGTGLMVLAVCLPLQAAVRRRWKQLLLGALLLAGGVALLALSNSPYVAVFFKRAVEFTQPGSSGFARFVGGFYLFEQFLWPDIWRALFGYGAGALERYQAKATWASGGNAVFKMVFEFGLVGGGAYLAFIGACLARSAAPLALRAAVGMTFLLGGVYVPFAHGLALGLLIWPAAGLPRNDRIAQGNPP